MMNLSLATMSMHTVSPVVNMMASSIFQNPCFQILNDWFWGICVNVLLKILIRRPPLLGICNTFLEGDDVGKLLQSHNDADIMDTEIWNGCQHRS